MVREKLLAASFRGKTFLMIDESVTRGKKFVNHEFPDSDRRFSEDLGKAPPIINATGIVHGALAIQKRLELEQALEIKGIGELVHPAYGKLLVNAGSFTVTSNQRSTGEFRFQMTFFLSETNITPSPKGTTKQKVSSDAASARIALDNALEKVYSVPKVASGIIAAGNKLTSSLTDLQSKMLLGENIISSKLSVFVNEVQSQLGNVYKTVGSVTDLKTALKAVYASAIAIVDSPELLAEAWKSMTEFNLGANGNTSDIGPTTTVNRLFKEQNNLSLDEHTRLSGLLNSFESLSYKDYTTDSDIALIRSFLDSHYTSFVDDSLSEAAIAGVVSIAADLDLRNAISDLRNSTRKVLDEADQNVWRVISIKPGISSMSIAVYRYYGDLEQIDTITGLNPDKNVANFDSEIKAISK